MPPPRLSMPGSSAYSAPSLARWVRLSDPEGPDPPPLSCLVRRCLARLGPARRCRSDQDQTGSARHRRRSNPQTQPRCAEHGGSGRGPDLFGRCRERHRKANDLGRSGWKRCGPSSPGRSSSVGTCLKSKQESARITDLHCQTATQPYETSKNIGRNRIKAGQLTENRGKVPLWGMNRAPNRHS